MWQPLKLTVLLSVSLTHVLDVTQVTNFLMEIVFRLLLVTLWTTVNSLTRMDSVLSVTLGMEYLLLEPVSRSPKSTSPTVSIMIKLLWNVSNVLRDMLFLLTTNAQLWLELQLLTVFHMELVLKEPFFVWNVLISSLWMSNRASVFQLLTRPVVYTHPITLVRLVIVDLLLPRIHIRLIYILSDWVIILSEI